MLSRILLFVMVTMAAAQGEVRQMTLREAVKTALERNPDLLLARLEKQAADLEVKIVRDPFHPHAVAGSGLAYSSGFPLSIEGSAPSILQVRVLQTLFNRPLSYRSAQVKEQARGAQISAATRQQEIAYRTANLALDAERASRLERLAGEQVPRLSKVAEIVGVRVAEGRALPIEEKRAKVDLARAGHRLRVAQENRRHIESSLAVVLGFQPEDRVAVIEDSARTIAEGIEDEESAVQAALDSNTELQRMRSAILAKQLEVRSHRAAWLPRVDLVAQYALLGRFNNYEEFFNRFQRNNVQLGASFQMSLLPSSGERAAASKAEVEAEKLRTEMNALRSQIVLDTRRAQERVKEAADALALARMDLDLAREEVSLIMAKMEEGRAAVGELENGRLRENEKWIAFYDATTNLEKARMALLHISGGLLAALNQ